MSIHSAFSVLPDRVGIVGAHFTEHAGVNAMSRRAWICLFVATLLVGCGNDGGNVAELLRPGERVRLNLADNVKIVAGNSVQLAVGFEAADETGNIRNLPCDHGKIVGRRKVLARVQFYDEQERHIGYQDFDLTNH
jgi:hypothetical protein